MHLPAVQQPDGACVVQAVASKDDVAEEVTKWRSKCAELEAAAAKQQVIFTAIHNHSDVCCCIVYQLCDLGVLGSALPVQM